MKSWTTFSLSISACLGWSYRPLFRSTSKAFLFESCFFWIRDCLPVLLADYDLPTDFLDPNALEDEFRKGDWAIFCP